MDAPAGTLVFARPAVKRTAFAEEPGTTIVALGGTPKAYEAQGGEIWMRAQPSLRVRRIRRGCRSGTRVDRSSSRVRRAALQPCVLREPRRSDRRRDQASPLAIDRKESFRSLAAEDSDFDPIRDEAAFTELVQGNAAEPTTG